MVLLGKHRAVLLSVSKMPSKATIVTLNANQAKWKWPNLVQTKDNSFKQQLKKERKGNRKCTITDEQIKQLKIIK
jgi:phosphoribosylcarboxyaminoimidazole (NCAIR) mutase